MLPKLLISRTLAFNVPTTECPIEMKFLVMESADQGIQHIPLQRKSKLLTLPTRHLVFVKNASLYFTNCGH